MDNTTNSTFNSTFNNTFNSTSGVPPAPKNFWTGLLLPIAYIVILVGSLYSFSSVYRQRQAQRASKLEPWFPAPTQRNIYLSLLHLDPSDADEGDGEKKLSKVPDSILKAALLKRAVEDIQRIMQLRQAKPALQSLLQRGSVGDEIWQRFQRAEQEIELEVKDVVNEANAFTPGWGQVIFQSANEIVNNLAIKQKVTELKEKLDEEKSWWDNRRQGIQSDFMKELDMTDSTTDSTKKPSSDDDAVLVDVSVPAGAQGSAKKKSKPKK